MCEIHGDLPRQCQLRTSTRRATQILVSDTEDLNDSLLDGLARDGFVRSPELSRSKRSDLLPYNLQPLGLSRVVAAAYIGLSSSMFDEMVKIGRMPEPRRFGTRTLWSRYEIDKSFRESLDEDGHADDIWDRVGP